MNMKIEQMSELSQNVAADFSVDTTAMSPQIVEQKQKPKIIFVGPPLMVNEVAAHLQVSDFQTVRVSYVKQMKQAVDENTVACIYVLPLKRSHVLSVHKNVRRLKDFKNMPFFVVAPEWVSARSEREMYKLGIRMIFDWNKEKSAFSDLISQALRVDLRSVRDQDTDKALHHAIENRLVTELAGYEPNIDITVYHGIAMLKGQVQSLQLRRKIIEVVRHTPGLRGLVDQSLTVESQGLTQPIMMKKANEILEKTYGLENRTMEVSFDESTGKLILEGTASTHKQVMDAIHRLEQLHGVQKVLNRVHVSEKEHKKDRFLAKRAQRLIKKQSLGASDRVRVKVLEGRALLKGSVSNAIESKHLSQALKSLDGIKDVENQLMIANAS